MGAARSPARSTGRQHAIRGLIRAHQGSSGLIRAHQGSSGLIKAHQGSSVALACQKNFLPLRSIRKSMG